MPRTRESLLEKPTTVQLCISEQVVLNEYFLFCHREFSSGPQKLLFCKEGGGGGKKKGEGGSAFYTEPSLHKMQVRMLPERPRTSASVVPSCPRPRPALPCGPGRLADLIRGETPSAQAAEDAPRYCLPWTVGESVWGPRARRGRAGAEVSLKPSPGTGAGQLR